MIVCFLSNISAKYCKNPSMLSRVIAKNVGDVFFETQCSCAGNWKLIWAVMSTIWCCCGISAFPALTTTVMTYLFTYLLFLRITTCFDCPALFAGSMWCLCWWWYCQTVGDEWWGAARPTFTFSSSRWHCATICISWLWRKSNPPGLL